MREFTEVETNVEVDEIEKSEKNKRTKRIKICFLIATPILVLSIATVVILNMFFTPKYKQVVAGDTYTAMMRDDGTVVVVGANGGEYNSDNWNDVISLSSGIDMPIGLKSDGTITGYITKDTMDWKNLIDISCSIGYCIGLKADGTIVSNFEIETDDWQGITDISAG